MDGYSASQQESLPGIGANLSTQENTRGQWPYRHAAMNDGHVALKRSNLRSEINFMSSLINILICILPVTAFLTTYKIIKGHP